MLSAQYAEKDDAAVINTTAKRVVYLKFMISMQYQPCHMGSVEVPAKTISLDVLLFVDEFNK